MNSVAYSPYELKFKSGKTRSGALLKFDLPEGAGFADCHPWPEFGDQDLKQQLKTLSDGILTTLTSRSLYFAKIDAADRAKRKNSLSDLEIPRSHYLVSSIDELNEPLLQKLWGEGFREIKIKLGRNLEKELEVLNSLLKTTKPFSLRFDFNGLPTAQQTREFLSQLDLQIYSQIEFIEDPIGPQAQEWFELQDDLGVTFARDFVEVENSEAHYFVRVVKPAVDDVFSLMTEEPESVEMVVTSYLDHPLGQVAAAYTAALLHKKIPDRTLLPGLLHHHVYEKNSFSELLSAEGPKFSVPPGTGFGFDDLLAAQDWKKL